jgi:hypothetical protein
MRGDELIVLTRAEFEALKRQADAAAQTGESFSAEEMQAIREQYEDRVAVVEERREELEWKLRLELAKIRDAELHARRAADEMRRVEQRLQALPDEGDDTQVRSTVPSAPLPPVAPRPHAAATLRKPFVGRGPAVPPPVPAASAPPPIPPATPDKNGTNGANGHSHADTFRAAMASRKRYVA